MSITDATDQASVYTEFSGLNDLRLKARQDDPAALKAVAKQFESMFLSMMLKSMREANAAFSEGNYLNNRETDFYQGMFDQQISLSLASSRGIGLAEVLEEQLSQRIGGDASEALSPESLSNLDKDNMDAFVKALTQLKNNERKNIPNRNEDADINVDAIKGSVTQVAVPVAAPAATQITKQETTPYGNSAETLVADKLSVGALGAGGLDTGNLDANNSEVENDAWNLLAKNIKGSAIEGIDSFISQLLPLAEKAGEALGIDAKVLLAQAGLETGWGKKVFMQGDKGFNLFNIKANPQWKGDSIKINALEYINGVAEKVKASFRAYDSFADSFRDYVQFIQDNPRYKDALASGGNSIEYLDKLQKAGYATDPNYSKKIIDIINRDDFLMLNTKESIKNGSGAELIKAQGLNNGQGLTGAHLSTEHQLDKGGSDA